MIFFLFNFTRTRLLTIIKVKTAELIIVQMISVTYLFDQIVLPRSVRCHPNDLEGSCEALAGNSFFFIWMFGIPCLGSVQTSREDCAITYV